MNRLKRLLLLLSALLMSLNCFAASATKEKSMNTYLEDRQNIADLMTGQIHK